MTDDGSQPITPLPGDPSGVEVTAMFSANDDTFMLHEGETGVFAAQTMLADGTNPQTVICLRAQLRKNKTDDVRDTIICMSPEDAMWFAKSVIRAAMIANAVKTQSN